MVLWVWLFLCDWDWGGPMVSICQPAPVPCFKCWNPVPTPYGSETDRYIAYLVLSQMDTCLSMHHERVSHFAWIFHIPFRYLFQSMLTHGNIFEKSIVLIQGDKDLEDFPSHFGEPKSMSVFFSNSTLGMAFHHSFNGWSEWWSC